MRTYFGQDSSVQKTNIGPIELKWIEKRLGELEISCLSDYLPCISIELAGSARDWFSCA